MAARTAIAAVWIGRICAGIAIVLLLTSLAVPWAESRVGMLAVTFGVPGIRACLSHTSVCKELDWEHLPALQLCLDALLDAAANQTCGGEPFVCAQVLPGNMVLCAANFM
jgi:hypothetical protein